METFREEEFGLRARGRLLMELSTAKDTLVRLKAGALDALSVGFVPLEWRDAAKVGADGKPEMDRWGDPITIRTFTKVRLMEVSFVVFGGNPEAKVLVARSQIDAAKTPREMEAALRDAGFSRNAAKCLISRMAFEKAPEPKRDAAVSELEKALRDLAADLRFARETMTKGQG